MTEDTPTETDRHEAVLADSPVRWEMTSEEIAAMSPEQLVQAVITLNEKVRRLYEVAMLSVHSEALNAPVKPGDIDALLNPEKDR